MSKYTPEVISRFWTKVDKRGPNECWEWRASRMKTKGYGRFQLKQTNHMAHRIAWEISFGDIPDGMVVCHKCDNPPCCNPNHLFIGTTRDNVHDKISKGRARYYRPLGEKQGRAKLTDEAVRQIRTALSQGVSQRALGRQHGVSHTVIRYIAIGRIWTHVK